MVTAFCHQLGWKNMETLISQFQDRLQFGIHSELLELMKLTSLNGIRARTLFDAGFETISSVASADVNVIENTLHKSMPFQSEKEREGDDDVDIRKRNKIKNIWITGCCGMTAREAAENLILEARKYLIQEIGVSEIKWKDLQSSENSLGTDTNKCKVDADIKQEGNITFKPENDLENQSLESRNNMTQKTTQEKIDDVHSCKSGTLAQCEVDKSVSKNIDGLQITEQNDDNNKIIDKVNSGKNGSAINVHNISILKNEQRKVTKSVFAPIKEDLMWESLNMTGAVLDNITRLRTSDKVLSPNISFGDSMDSPSALEVETTNMLNSKYNSTKDISLFSSEGDNSGIFEESLDLLTDISVENKPLKLDSQIKNFQTSTDYIDINTKSILNAFESPIIISEDGEDIKLVYDDENEEHNEANRFNLNKSEENEIINTQDFKEPRLRNSFISPLKRGSYLRENNSPFVAKKSKSSHFKSVNETEEQFTLKSSKSASFTLKFTINEIKCYILRESDIHTNFENIKNTARVSVFLDTNTTQKSGDIIGSNIIFKKPTVETQIETIEECPIKGVVLCINHNLCFYMDLTSLGKFLPTFKLKIAKLFSDVSYKLKMYCTKTNYVRIKKWLGKDLLSECVDISLAEWLLDNDERITKITDLVSLSKNFNQFLV